MYNDIKKPTDENENEDEILKEILCDMKEGFSVFKKLKLYFICLLPNSCKDLGY